MHLKPINQQVVVIIGASSGIGRVTALKFAERGAKLVLAARGQDKLDSLVAEIERMGGTAVAKVADMADWDQVKAVADWAIAVYERIDTWVHNASIAFYAKFEDMTPDEFKHVIDVNLVGQAYGAMAALPHLKREGRGALIHVASIESQVAFPFQSAYAASKHGIPGFLDALRLELRHDNIPISVTTIMPAAINTPFYGQAKTKLGVKPNAVPPVYQPETVADQIVYAAEHPVRDLIAGGSGKAFITINKLSPRLMDALRLVGGFAPQKTSEPKGPDESNNFYTPLPDQRIEGEWSNQALKSSAYNWLTRHPFIRRTLLSVAVGAVALLASRATDDD